MEHQKATKSVISNASRQEVIKKREYMSFGVKRVAQCLVDGTHQLITGESIGYLNMELDSTRAQLKEAAARIESLREEQEEKDERNRAVIASLTRRQRKADAEIIWQKDVVHRTKASLREEEEAHKADVVGLTECLSESNLRYAAVKDDNASLQETVDSLQAQLKESEVCYLELSKSGAKAHFNLWRSRLEAERLFREVQVLKRNTMELREENHRLSEELEESETSRKANILLAESLWSEVYEPTNRSLPVRQLRKAELTIEAKEAVINTLNFRLALITPLPQALDDDSFDTTDEGESADGGDADSKLLEAAERISALESEKEELSLQIASEHEAVIELRADVEDLVTCLKSDNEDLSLQIVAERAAVAELGAQVKDLSQKLERSESETDELREDVAGLDIDNRVLDENLSLAERRILTLRSECEKAAQDRRYIVSIYEARETELSEQVKGLKQEMSQQQKAAAATNGGLEEKVRCGEVEAFRSAAKISQLQRQKEGLQIEVARLEGVAKDGAEKLEECKMVVSKLNIEMAALSSAAKPQELATVSQSPSSHMANDTTTPSGTANVPSPHPPAGRPIQTFTSKARHQTARPSVRGHSWVDLSAQGQHAGPSRNTGQQPYSGQRAPRGY